jgi:hypothetical protein
MKRKTIRKEKQSVNEEMDDESLGEIDAVTRVRSTKATLIHKNHGSIRPSDNEKGYLVLLYSYLGP